MNIPTVIDGTEKIVRVLLYPSHVTKNENSIKTIAFRSPSGIDEVSVIRLDYSTPNFCKIHGKKIQNPENKRAYFGFAVLVALEIRSVDADVIYTPKDDNKAHADITIGYIPEKHKPLPSRFKLKAEEMARKARMYKDPNPNDLVWNGQELL